MTNINIVIPAAGIGSRFLDYGFKETKFLLPIDKNLKPMINGAINTLITNSKNEFKFTFIFILRLNDKNKDEKLEEYLKNICLQENYNVFIKWIDYVTEGPASSAYLVKDLVNNNDPLIISNSDQILNWDFSDFYDKCVKYDGCVLTYNPPYNFNIGDKDKHSFVKFDENNIPIEFVEKIAISKEALIGVHYYKTGIIFLNAYEYIYNNNIRAPNGEFYLSYTYQGLINMGYTVGTYKLPDNNYFYPVGEPIDYFNYYNKNCPIYKSNLNRENRYIIEDKLKEYMNYFSIHFASKNEKINLNGKLFILINGKTNIDKQIFILNNYDIIFLEDSSYIIFNLNENHSNEILNIKDYTRGWLVGDFKPSIENNKIVEFGYLSHKKNSLWDYHYHKESIEINILVKGAMKINNIEYIKNDLFIIDKNVISCPLFLDDCEIICIKLPSSPKDKYIV
jgi:dTDP-glucose pyrophosphorylase